MLFKRIQENIKQEGECVRVMIFIYNLFLDYAHAAKVSYFYLLFP